MVSNKTFFSVLSTSLSSFSSSKFSYGQTFYFFSLNFHIFQLKIISPFYAVIVQTQTKRSLTKFLNITFIKNCTSLRVIPLSEALTSISIFGMIMLFLAQHQTLQRKFLWPRGKSIQFVTHDRFFFLFQKISVPTTASGLDGFAKSSDLDSSLGSRSIFARFFGTQRSRSRSKEGNPPSLSLLSSSSL